MSLFQVHVPVSSIRDERVAVTVKEFPLFWMPIGVSSAVIMVHGKLVSNEAKAEEAAVEGMHVTARLPLVGFCFEQ